MRTTAIAASLFLVSACTVGATGPEDGTGGNGGPDAGGAGGADAGDDTAASCQVPDDLGVLGEMVGAEASQVNQSGSMGARKIYRLNVDLNDDAEKDAFSLQLWDERGVFVGPAEPGTYEIGGDEANFETCGVCTTVLGNIVPMQGARQFYIAQSGTVTIDSIDPTFAGSLNGVTLQEFDLQTGEPIDGGCTTQIQEATFSADLQILDP